MSRYAVPTAAAVRVMSSAPDEPAGAVQLTSQSGVTPERAVKLQIAVGSLLITAPRALVDELIAVLSSDCHNAVA